MGMYFDAFSCGQHFISPRRTITEGDIGNFAGLSADFNPVHTDALYAATTPFGARIAHGPMIIGMAFGMGARTGLFDGTVLGLLDLQWSFSGPVFIHDTLHADIEVLDTHASKKTDRGVVTLRFLIINQRDETVQTGVAKILMRREQGSAA